jgi:hypothetical protein
MLTSRTPVDSGPDLEHLPGTPWSMRAAAASGGRAALEMYDAGTDDRTRQGHHPWGGNTGLRRC